MTEKKLKKLPLSRARLEQAMARKNLTIRSLGAQLSSWGDQKEYMGSDKTIRRALKETEDPGKPGGGINERILDNIARILDVTPRYLSGEYDELLNELDDAGKEFYTRTFLNPANYPYASKEFEEADYRDCIETILRLCKVPSAKCKSLSTFKKLDLEIKLWESICEVLRASYPECRFPDECYGYGYTQLTANDVYEMMAPDPPPEFYEGWDKPSPLDEKYKDLPILG